MTTSTPPGDPTKQGSQTDTSKLPGIVPDGVGFFGSSYSPADAMKTPGQIGVTVGDSMSDVISGVKGVGFYIDQIGFGAPSTRLTQGMPLKPLGVNYYIQTGSICSNGAEMWHYMKGITEGDALGENMKIAMEEMGLPPLKGLAPGMIEDAENALNPMPLISSLFGSGYPQCRQVTLPVGDAYGRISDPRTNETWISHPETAELTSDGYVQTKWIQDIDDSGNPLYLSRDQYEAAEKTQNVDGTDIEGFINITNPSSIIVIGVLCLLAFGIIKH